MEYKNFGNHEPQKKNLYTLIKIHMGKKLHYGHFIRVRVVRTFLEKFCQKCDKMRQIKKRINPIPKNEPRLKSQNMTFYGHVLTLVQKKHEFIVIFGKMYPCRNT